ncbi:HAD-IIIA family hydrolase [Fulvivirga sp.]|uniref:D-glycero-alpha-D-manno-heptose-1,7-bisphosphate 7-phosphatase n=1 Tax=Fulvivirga sp. TaxID=1931237 RepID=UPI0032EBDAB8
MNKCIFLDRDGVLNKDFVDYVYSEEKLFILSGVENALESLKNAGYLLVIITNQSGISQGIYTEEDMNNVHRIIQEKCGGVIDDIYFAPGHPSKSESLSRKPGSLMFERAIARHNIDIGLSWMVGDKHRDLVPAKKLGIKCIQVDHSDSILADYKVADLPAAVEVILG